jgi:hypothetical protein
LPETLFNHDTIRRPIDEKMSVKFQRETVRTASVEGVAAMGASLGDKLGDKLPKINLPGMSGDNPVVEAIGTALKGGEKKKSTAAKGYLGVRFPLPRHCCDSTETRLEEDPIPSKKKMGKRPPD